MAKLLIFAALAGAAMAWECEDLHDECPQWMGNMGGDCKGQDYEYMLHNCPKTCDICTEAKEKWEKEEEERKKSPTYEPEDSAVIIVDGEDIDEFIESESADNLILMEFFAPWCGHCQHVAPSYRAAAKELADLSEAGKLPVPVKLAKYDDGDQGRANQMYRAGDPHKWNITSYPSLFVVGGPQKFSSADSINKGEEWFDHVNNKERYWGGHETEEIVHHMTQLSHGKNQTEARIAYHEIEKGMKPGMYKKGGKHETEHMVELDPDNFVETMLRDDALWIVEYYSDKCPICDSLAPEITKGAKDAMAEINKDGKIKLKYGGCNSRVYDDLAEAFGVGSYPWVASFFGGKKLEDMAGMGGSDSFKNWGIEQFNKYYKEGGADKTAEVPPPPKKDEKDEL